MKFNLLIWNFLIWNYWLLRNKINSYLHRFPDSLICRIYSEFRLRWFLVRIIYPREFLNFSPSCFSIKSLWISLFTDFEWSRDIDFNKIPAQRPHKLPGFTVGRNEGSNHRNIMFFQHCSKVTDPPDMPVPFFLTETCLRKHLPDVISIKVLNSGTVFGQIIDHT